MIQHRAGLLALPLLLSPIAVAQDAAVEEESSIAEDVRQYIRDVDLLERAGDPERIVDVIVADIDNDGSQDAVVHYAPKYRQSPTILIYTVDAKDKIARVIEGLAPGPVQSVSGELEDMHVTGEAVDFGTESGFADAASKLEFSLSALDQFGYLVVYENFYHAEARTGRHIFVDMSHARLDPEIRDCEDFEVSPVRQISVGPLEGQSHNVLAAWVADEIWIYTIEAVREDGLLEKSVQTVPVPAGFAGFVPGQGLTYRMSDNSTAVLQ